MIGSQRTRNSWTLAVVFGACLCMLVACSSDGKGKGSTDGTSSAAQANNSKSSTPATPNAPAKPKAKNQGPMGLMLGLAQFVKNDEGKRRPGAARLDILMPEGDTWKVKTVEDPDSNVFHKGFVYSPAGDGKDASVITLGGMKAKVKSWSKDGSGKLAAKVLWEKDFGGKISRMRDAEVADLDGDGKMDMAVAAHDTGVVAVLMAKGDGTFEAREIDKSADGERIFVHEIEIGDLNGDKTLEVYATPSEPNRFDGKVQTGRVVSYTPSKEGDKPKIVADLGDRHAKEILVTDIDGDGKDELYVAVEAKVKKVDGKTTLVEPVEIRRYDAGTDPKKGVVVAKLQDRLCRFLTAGDVDGDGKREIVAAPFKSGLWLLRPGADPKAGKWSAMNFDTNSSGFEHAAILSDLDGDGKDELYVASDDQGEVRMYTWKGTGFAKKVLLKRDDPKSVFTWNIMPVPLDLVK